MQARDYQDVVAITQDIIDQSRRDNDRVGYFAALYARVTSRIQQSIDAGEFDDGARMDRMITTFANRYFAALTAYRAGEKASGPWQITFEMTERWNPTLLQHLLLAMNAHINFDLGIAAATVAPGDQLATFQQDFDRINDVLDSLMTIVEDEFGKIWPIIITLDKLLRGEELHFLYFDMGLARREAWNVATTLAPLTPEEQAPLIAKLDGRVSFIGRVIARPIFPINAVMLLMRVTDRNTVAQVIDILDAPIPNKS